MRRWYLTIPAFLLLGAVVNVAVAWGCAFLSLVDYRESRHRPPSPVWSKYGYCWTYHRGTNRIHAGWPTLCMQATSAPIGPGAFRPAIRILRSLPRAPGVREARYFPLGPKPLLFVTNTACYGAVLWVLLGGPFALRRFLRVRRGLCPKCAYPMGESAVCTECGKPLTVPIP